MTIDRKNVQLLRFMYRNLYSAFLTTNKNMYTIKKYRFFISTFHLIYLYYHMLWACKGEFQTPKKYM